MLRGIPSVISPELMSVLMRMGHGDELVLADGNFPADSHARRIVRADGLDVPTLLTGILQLLPIDDFTDDVAVVMRPVNPTAEEPRIWKQYRQLLSKAEERTIPLTPIERFAFYERARNAYAIVATSETAIYANLILKKGILAPDGAD